MKQVWSEIKAKLLVFVWVIAVAPLAQTIFLRQCIVVTDSKVSDFFLRLEHETQQQIVTRIMTTQTMSAPPPAAPATIYISVKGGLVASVERTSSVVVAV